VAGRPGRPDVVVIVHGVTSQRDRPWARDLAAALSAREIAVVQFSFSGNGASEGRFEDATPTKEVEDLGSILDAFAGWRVACIGHSMGSAVGLLRAGSDPRIAVLVSLAGMVHVHRFMQRHFGPRPLGGEDPSAARPVPVILITYATTEDAVRRALAKVEAERVIEGKPQLIRIEKT